MANKVTVNAPEILTFFQNTATANTVMSSLIGEAKKIILSYFPRDYIRHCRISSGLAIIDENMNKYHNNDVDKIPYPSMTISPEFSLENPYDLGKYTYLTNPNINYLRNAKKINRCILSDPDNKFAIYSYCDKLTVNAYFSIKVNTFTEAVKLGKFLDGHLFNQVGFYNHRLISVELPKNFIKIITQLNGFASNSDLDTILEHDLDRLQVYLASVCQTDEIIELKKDLGSGRYGFFYGTYVNINGLITDLNVPNQPIKDNSIEGEYEINFRFQMTANNPNIFRFDINKNKLLETYSYDHRFKDLLLSSANGSESTDGFYSINIPIQLSKYNQIDNFTSLSGHNWIGHNVVHEKYTYDGHVVLNELHLGNILKSDLLKFHSYAKTHNYDITNLFHIQVIADSYNINNKFEIDYDNLVIKFNNYLQSEFLLNIWVNRAAFESIEIAMKKHNFYSLPHAISSLKVSYYDGNNKLKSKEIALFRFKSDAEMESDAIDKQLRIYTNYGICYVGLVEEKDIYASPFKVCLGFDDLNIPIIRCLRLVDNAK